MQKAVYLLLFLSFSAQAYVYSVPSMVEEIFSGRKENTPVEIVLRHNLGESNRILRENIYYGDNRIFIEWEVEGDRSSRSVASVDKDVYDFGSGGRFARSSKLFLQYFLLKDPNYFSSSLREERFVNRDQMNEFRSGYTPEGSPKTYDPKKFYVKHDDIAIKRLENGDTAIAVVGLNEGLDKRIVYFEKNVQGIRRLEWQEEGRSTAWNFENFQKMPSGGVYPRRLSLTQGGAEVIRSEVVAVRNLSKEQWDKLRQSLSRQDGNRLSSPVKSNLALLLRFR